VTISLPLSVTRNVRRAPRLGHTRAGEGDDAQRKNVIGQGRFNNRCFACAFQFGSWDGFELHHLDGDHGNSASENLVPICFMCHWPLHLDLTLRELSPNPGRIIYLPELQQAELNQLLYAIGAHGYTNSQHAEPKAGETDQNDRSAWSVYSKLEARAEAVEKANGKTVRPGLSQVHAMVRLLQDVGDDRYASRDEWLAGCRYLPPLSEVIKRATDWSTKGAAFSNLPVASWKSIAGVAA